MGTLSLGGLIYISIGLVFAVWHMRSDWRREKRGQALRKSLAFEAKERPIWIPFVGFSVLRVLLWPLHLMLHED